MLKLFRSTLYLRLQPERLTLLHIESGQEFSDVPEIAILRKSGKPSAIAVGADARSKAGITGVTVMNGFRHPRTLIADFSAAELTLKYFVAKVVPRSILAVSPVMVIHPLSHLEGGLTQIEIRALVEMGMGTGARKVMVWEGRELTRDELSTLSFPETAGKVLFS